MIRFRQQSEILDAMPPANRTAEIRLLCCLHLQPELMLEVGRLLKADHFYSYDTRAMYKAMRKVYFKSKSLDGEKILATLKACDVQADWSKLYYDICWDFPHAAYWKEYVASIREAAIARHVIGLLTEGLRGLYNGTKPDKLAGSIAKRLYAISKH